MEELLEWEVVLCLWVQKRKSPFIEIRKKNVKKYSFAYLAIKSTAFCGLMPNVFLLIITSRTCLDFFSFFLKVLCLDAWSHGLDFLSDPNCKLEDKAEDGEVLDCKKRPDEGEELEEEAVHSCDSCLQVFESLSDITEHKINQCQLTGKQYLSLRGFLHCSISASYFLFLISLFLSQLFYSCSWMLRWDLL